MHNGDRIRKSTIIHFINEISKNFNKKIVCTFPIENTAMLLSNSQIFHFSFKANTKFISLKDTEVMSKTFDDKLILIIINEVLMFLAENLVALDE